MIRGLVQGVGFRPFISRLAREGSLRGEVVNRNDGVSIRLAADLNTVNMLKDQIISGAPPASVIQSVDIEQKDMEDYDSFYISSSTDNNNSITEVCPDIAVCGECLEDMATEGRRKDYPFVNCTNCGPRFTITTSLPYDRPNTSMKYFEMCSLCGGEYEDISDRRYHAQPVACNHCGPVYRYRGRRTETDNLGELLTFAGSDISEGRIIAVKGLGGYFLACDALNEQAVMMLREKKHRDSKPFAVMFRNIDSLRQFCHTCPEEEELLLSWRRPVVILNERTGLSPSVSGGLGTVGALLPYMPLHYLLFNKTLTPAIVFTSGNVSDEPIITDDHEAELKLGRIADSVISGNREIINRTDDSVAAVAGGTPFLIRRSRGYVPQPVYLNTDTEGIFAAGPELKNTFCIGKGNQAILSQHIGDLKNADTYDFYLESIARFSELFRFRTRLVACDMHPAYLSTSYSEELAARENIEIVRVQHHHAHVASCMAENKLEGKVTGICFDGTGYGTDGKIWGSEFLIAGYDTFERYASFEYVPLPGGDRAVKEPWRTAYSYCRKYIGENFDFHSIISPGLVSHEASRMAGEMIRHEINSPLSCSAGRLFDAVSALLGICISEHFDSEAPMRLEAVADRNTDDSYPYYAGKKISFGPAIACIIDDIRAKVPAGVISARFHNTVAEAVVHYAGRIRQTAGPDRVVLTGGVFQNRYLLERCFRLLKRDGFKVFTNTKVPLNDGGVSLGQLAVAATYL